MSIELKAGLWGVSRDGRVWGPISATPLEHNAKDYPFSEGFYTWTRGGSFIELTDKHDMDIIATFKTKAAAKAFAAGKPAVKEINFQRLALRMSKANSITEVREIYRKAVSK